MAYTTDPIADLLTRIRNANKAEHESVEISASRLKQEIVRILHEEGFIKGYEVIEQTPQNKIRVYLKYGPRREKVITNLKRISKPGRRVYCKKDEVPRVLRGLGIAIISTSHGVMTDREARRRGVGGEVICYVY
ncbi:MAG TPA: 30S ribosomal protein S8 [Chthonomonas sp.]|uniref:30S ribosomal protein S8 n=1 Tax=Chthonomonas sp. TaxID=2282153 RepID=UPI002B4ACDE7|nr:30S ribosomal protein S8 [Chthonomonas sp.]HLI49609.1 30S ribosomal protein S8 [Chthonomonas sp.]